MTYDELREYLAHIDGASAALSEAEKSARAEGVREGMLKAAELYAEGEGWDYFGAAYDAIRAAAEAKP